ncbi:MAG: hypothetical protein BWY83_02610 [bacterium ADurb.Bin478]|nr:MAG: hypothetical protein BWY83_02610 [bacterium ADurb.Bin478]
MILSMEDKFIELSASLILREVRLSRLTRVNESMRVHFRFKRKSLKSNSFCGPLLVYGRLNTVSDRTLFKRALAR